MKRNAIEALIKWKDFDHRLPVLLTGAKGVGKTYLAYDFAKAFFSQIYYINFERQPILNRLFRTKDVEIVKGALEEYLSIELETRNSSSILILDEINCCDELLQLLNTAQLNKYFEYIIAISSKSIPNKRQDNLNIIPIFPLEFDEFLRAIGNEWYIELIMTHFNSNTKIPDIVHKELLGLHQLYLQIGGLPNAVNEYLHFNTLDNIAEQHSLLIGAYHDNIYKFNTDSDGLKMRQVFDSIIFQLIKENKKFQYKLIRKGTTHSMYKEAINKLTGIQYIIKCCRISSEQLNVPNEIDKELSENFKLYLQDTGLLYTEIVEEYGRADTGIYKSALLENYVAQTLHAKNYSFAFWESDSIAKIDFILIKHRQIIPIELFVDENTRSKSISVFKQKCQFEYSIKLSARNFEFSNQIKYVPYYAAFCI